MNRLSLATLAALTLTACTPALEQRIMTDTVTYTYQSSCARVLTALEGAAVRIQPGLFKGEGNWSALDLAKKEGNRRVFISREGRRHQLGNNEASTVMVTASCAEVKGSTYLTLSSDEQPKPWLGQLHKLIYDNIRLP